MAFETLDYSVENGIAWIEFNRPDTMNTFNYTVRDEIIAAFDLTDNDPAVGAVVLTGSGRAFCAGADLSGAGETFASARRDVRDSGGMVSLRMFESKKPLIAAWNGHAIGIGATMSLPADVRISVPDAKVGFVFTRRGIVPEAASTWFLPRLVGIPTTLDWLMSGRVFDAREAHAAGLVQHLCEPSELRATAIDIAERLTSESSTVSVAAVRRLVWHGAGVEHPMRAHEAESVALHASGKGSDAVEGVVSFLEKRPAEFAGRVPGDELPTSYEAPEFNWRG